MLIQTHPTKRKNNTDKDKKCFILIKQKRLKNSQLPAAS